MADIYKHEHVEASQKFYGELLINYMHWPVFGHLDMLAQKLLEGYQSKHPVVAGEINNYHPDWLGKAPDLIFQAGLSLADIQQTIASQYGFSNWESVEQKDQPYSAPFEESLKALLAGETATLKELLASNPDLVKAHSPYGHQAQLIHYVGNNGVEMWRQQVPLNLAEVIQVLLDAGADKSATMPVYGGQFTALQLFESSAHPYDAGNREEVLELLR